MLPVSFSAAQPSTPAKPQAAADEFSRLFVEMMLRQATEPVWNDAGENSMPGANEMVNQCLAQKVAASDPFHIARMVMESIQQKGAKPC